MRLDRRATHGLQVTLARLPEPPPRPELPLWPSHVAIAVADLDAAEATFAGGLGLDVERRFEADYGDFAASALYTGGREVLALMAGRTETSAVSRRMRGMTSEANPLGEGFYLASWAASDPAALAARVERAGGLVAWQQRSFFIHPALHARRAHARLPCRRPPRGRLRRWHGHGHRRWGNEGGAPRQPLERRGAATRRVSRRHRSRSR